MMTGEGHIQTRSSTFWAMRFGRADRRIAKERSSSTSVRLFPTKRCRRSGWRFEAGTCIYAATSESKICRGCACVRDVFNPKIRGWLQYYGRYYRSALYPPMRQLDRSLARWAYRKYKKLRGHLRRAGHRVARISRRDPKLFASLADGCAAWLHGGSRMS